MKISYLAKDSWNKQEYKDTDGGADGIERTHCRSRDKLLKVWGVYIGHQKRMEDKKERRDVEWHQASFKRSTQMRTVCGFRHTSTYIIAAWSEASGGYKHLCSDSLDADKNRNHHRSLLCLLHEEAANSTGEVVFH